MGVRTKTFKDWMRDNFTRQDLWDIQNDGKEIFRCLGILPCHAYCNELYDKFEDEIWLTVNLDAVMMGYKDAPGVLDFLAEILRGYCVCTGWELKTAMVLYAAQRAAWDLLYEKKGGINNE